MTLLILFALLALGVSFACSVFEAVLLSVTPSYVAALEQADRPRSRRTGRLLKCLKEDVDRPLAAILTLNTIAHTAGAAGVGAQAQLLWGNRAVTIASAVMTLLILVTSEIIPKTIGAVYWRGLSAVVARALRLLIWALYPFVVLAQSITGLLSRDRDATEISREELGALATLSVEEGVLEEEENRMLQNLLRLRSIKAKDIMTPRTVAVMLPEKLTVGEVVQTHGAGRFSRIPVFAGNRDEVTGFVLKTDLLLAASRDQFARPLSELRRPLAQIQQDAQLAHVLEKLLTTREQLALVVDEFGGTAGLLTLEDVVETLIGEEIVDETDKERDLRALAREQWTRRARERGLLGEEDRPSAG
ncbi:MAG: CNNM domain-containing protein [Myxococcales bacterium]